ncbi:MAG TPA: response regulator transcription factor [Ktedonosporobacter sp.]|jgi:DNA-binding NarL/FixJ family response regulator|nr:response regulator transcription factor [Ktedonosporobacter sp.]
MIQNVLVADPCELLRIGLRTIILENIPISNIYEASTRESLKTLMQSYALDLLVVNQSLITDVSMLPQDKCVILTSEPDIRFLRAAYKYGIRGYLSDKVSPDLLRIVICSSEETLLIEPSLMSWIMENMFGGAFSSVKEELLTPREREIMSLLREGVDRPTIAKRLCITEVTLKTHIKNISRKC